MANFEVPPYVFVLDFLAPAPEKASGIMFHNFYSRAPRFVAEYLTGLTINEYGGKDLTQEGPEIEYLRDKYALVYTPNGPVIANWWPVREWLELRQTSSIALYFKQELDVKIKEFLRDRADEFLSYHGLELLGIREFFPELVVGPATYRWLKGKDKD